MKGLNLSTFKKTSENPQSVTMTHKDGHKLVMAKHGLDPLHRKQLEKLPLHLDQGGAASLDESTTVADEDRDIAKAPGITDTAPQSVAPQSTPASSGASGDWTPADPADKAVDQEDAQASTPAAGIPASGLPGMPNTGNTDFIAQGNRAIREKQAVDSQLASSQAELETKNIAAQQDNMAAGQKFSQDYQAHQQEFMQDYANNHIDPKHYQESMSSGAKAGAAIDLFLGGLGSAFTHQGNPALDFLNKQIDRDIGAQESRVGQQKTLLEANQNLYHDGLLAQNATRAQMNDIYSHQMQLAAAKLGTPQAKAAADMATANWQRENYGLAQQNQIRAAVMHGLQNGGQGVTPLALETAGYIPKGEGVKEQQSLDAQKTAITGAKDIFNQYDKEQTTGNLLNPESARRVDALNGQLVNTVMNASASKRLNEPAIEHEMQPFMIKTTDDRATRQAKLNGVLNAIGKHADPTPYTTQIAPGATLRSQYPFNNPQSAWSPQDQAVLREAQAHPNNPKSVQVVNLLKNKYGG